MKADGAVTKVHGQHQGLNGYTASKSKSATSAPVMGLSDLAGVGGLLNVANRSSSAFQTNENNPNGLCKSHDACYPQVSQLSGRTSNIKFPENDDDFIPMYDSFTLDFVRRSSNGAVKALSSNEDSIFSTRPSSITSASSILDSSIGSIISGHARNSSIFRKALSSSSSSLNAGRDSPRVYRGNDMQRYPLLPTLVLDRLVTTTTPRHSSTSWVANQDHAGTVYEQITRAGWIAQQHRLNRDCVPDLLQEGSSLDIENPASLLADPGPKAEKGPEESLSTIEERVTDVGAPSDGTASMIRHNSGGNVVEVNLVIPQHSPAEDTTSLSGTEDTTDMRFTSSNKDTRERDNTPATSFASSPGRVADEETDSSEADESISDISGETDESFHETFDATSLHPALLAVAIALKDRITSLVLARVSKWVETYSPDQSARDEIPNFSGSSGTQNGAGITNGTVGCDGSGKKRGFDDNSADGAGRGNGNDQDKRRKTEALSAEAFHNLACPFVKRYPREKQPRCQKGWPTVHRIKYVYTAST